MATPQRSGDGGGGGGGSGSPPPPSRPTWADLEASRPMRMRFRLLASIRPYRVRSSKRGERAVVDGRRAPGPIDLTPAFELELPSANPPTREADNIALPSESSSSSSSSSRMPVYRLLSPTLTQDVLSSSSGSQPLINLDGLLLAALGITPLFGLLKLGLSRFHGEYQVDLPSIAAGGASSAEAGASLTAQEARRITAWQKGVWVSLPTARRAVKELSDSGGQRGTGREQLLKSFGPFLSWSTREAWSLDEQDEQGRVTHNWMPSPTALHPSSALSTASLLSAQITSIALLPHSNPTASTFVPSSHRQQLMSDYLETQSGKGQAQKEAVRTKLRRWTVDLVEAVEVWKEDWPEDDGTTDRKVTDTVGLFKSAYSTTSTSAPHARDWRESTLNQLLPILFDLPPGVWDPSALQAILPRNLPEELRTQIYLVEKLWLLSEGLINSDNQSIVSQLAVPQTERQVERRNEDTASDGPARASSHASLPVATVSSTSTSRTRRENEPDPSSSSSETENNASPAFSVRTPAFHSRYHDGDGDMEEVESRRADLPHRSPSRWVSGTSTTTSSATSESDDPLVSFRVHFLGDWIRFNFVIGRFHPRDRVVDRGGGRTAAIEDRQNGMQRRGGRKVREDNVHRGNSVESRLDFRRSRPTRWVWISVCLALVAALVIALAG